MTVLGIHILTGEWLLALLRRVEAGEDADAVYAEVYMESTHVGEDADLDPRDEQGTDDV